MSLEVNISEPDDFNCEELHTSIEEVAIAKGFTDFEYNVDCISGKGGNYIANVFRVVIRETDCDKDSFSVIVKTLVNTERQELFHELHKREVIAYNDIIKKFDELQSTLDEETKLMLPECLYTRIEKNNEVIVLSDLKVQGFQIDNKLANLECLSFEQTSAVISELAKFHALSFVLEKQDPEKFKEIKVKFPDLIFEKHFLNKSKLKNYFFESFEMSLKLVTDKEAKNKLKKVKDSLLKLLQMYTKEVVTNVLCHGDCWVNNMLFKQEDNNESKICFIDYQAMRYSNPLTDIMYFLYICTDSKFRSDHVNQLKNIYYDNLISFGSLFDTDINYTKEEFNSDWIEYLPYGLIIAMIELRLVTMTPEEDATLKGARITSNWDLTQVPDESVVFKERVNDVVREATNNGALDKLLEITKSLN